MKICKEHEVKKRIEAYYKSPVGQLQQAMIDHNLRPWQICEILGCSPSQFSRWVRKGDKPIRKYRLKIEDLLKRFNKS